jgi:hypothetical protein
VNERRKDLKQTSGFISTYSADTFGVCSALFELGGMVVMHDASGCNSTYTTHDEPRWYDMDSMVYISGLTEIEAIMGDDAKLIADITEAAKELSPRFIAIVGTPIPAMTGFDFDAASAVITAETGIPAYGFKTTGMRSYIYGAGEAFLRIADCMVNRNITRSENQSVNILGLTPLDFSINKSAESIIGHYAKKGYDIISTWAMGCTLEDMKKAGGAHMNLVVSETGLPAAVRLKELFGTPYSVGVPVGGEDIDITDMYPAGDPEKNRSAVFSSGDGDVKVLIIGEGVSSKSLAKYLNIKTGRSVASLTATDLSEDEISETINGYKNLETVIADPLFKPLCKSYGDEKGMSFVSLPHEAFSGRLYRKDIPDLIKDANEILKSIRK